jgi:hypothetical protein
MKKMKKVKCRQCDGSGLNQDMSTCFYCVGNGEILVPLASKEDEKTTFSKINTTEIPLGHPGMDNITKPKHYYSGNIDVIYFLENYFPSTHKVTVKEGFYLANVLKYVSRYKMKGKPLEDLEKARFYLDKLIELEK